MAGADHLQLAPFRLGLSGANFSTRRGSTSPTLRRSEDSFMDELIGELSERGFPTVRVNFPRSYVDVNREPYELDPRMFTGRLPSFANTRSMRVAGGLGTIPRVVGDGQEIYRERISVDDALGRIETLYKPYHRALRRLINKAHQAFGTVDPGGLPLDAVGRRVARRTAAAGHRDRRPLRHELRAAAARRRRETHERARLIVGRNKPYAGGFITEHYGNPASGLHTDPARTQPRDLHGRAAARARPAISADRRRFRGARRCAGRRAARRSRPVPGGRGIDARSCHSAMRHRSGTGSIAASDLPMNSRVRDCARPE